MADDGMTVRIDEVLATQVKAAAAAKGVPVEVYVEDALASYLRDGMAWDEDLDPAIDDAIGDEALRTGDTVPAEDVVAWMRSWFTPHELPKPAPTKL